MAFRSYFSGQVEPNHFSRSSAMSSASWPQALDLLKARSIVDTCHDVQVSPNRVCYVAAMASCAASFAWETWP